MIKIDRNKMIYAVFYLLVLNALVILKYDSMNAGSAHFWTIIIPLCNIVCAFALYISK